MTARMDIDYLKSWIGREETAQDVLTASLADRFQATLGLAGDPLSDGAAAPRLIHFCLCQPAVTMDALGNDGHPTRGGFLPPVPLPRRMWAASEIRFTGDLAIGDAIARRSRIADVQVKEGSTGTLCFVTVEHEISGNGALAVQDTQTIVYRGDKGSATPAAAAAPAAPPGDHQAAVAPSAPMLFRYSALTFNTHRIHYDLPYATQVEGYDGLVVHGPLQATLLLNFAAWLRGGVQPDRFSFRSASPLFDTSDFMLHAGPLNDGTLDLWTARPSGPYAMRALAEWGQI